MYITIEHDIDLDDLVNDDDNREEILKALERNGHHLFDTATMIDEIKEARRTLTSLIRQLEE